MYYSKIDFLFKFHFFGLNVREGLKMHKNPQSTNNDLLITKARFFSFIDMKRYAPTNVGFSKRFSSAISFFSFFLLFLLAHTYINTRTHNGKNDKILQMSWQRVYLAVGLFGVLLLLTSADNSVHILSKYQQLITSTTLNWLPRSHYDSSREIVIGGFEIEESEGTCS